MSELGEYSDEEERSSGDSGESGGGSDTENGSSSYGSTESESGSESDADSEEEEEFEPVLKYRRFARDVIASISQGQGGEESNVICCIAVHSKVCWCSLIRDTLLSSPSAREKGLVTLGKLLGPTDNPWRNFHTPIRLCCSDTVI